jgi:hypothetical protein
VNTTDTKPAALPAPEPFMHLDIGEALKALNGYGGVKGTTGLVLTFRPGDPALHRHGDTHEHASYIPPPGQHPLPDFEALAAKQPNRPAGLSVRQHAQALMREHQTELLRLLAARTADIVSSLVALDRLARA